MLPRAIRACSLAIAVLATVVPAQSPPQFRFTKDLIPSGAGPVLALVDFDLDGDLDLLTNGTGIYLNDGNGTFTPHPVLSSVTAFPYQGLGGSSAAATMPVFAIGDLNGDGYPDVLALTGYPTTAVQWMNQGNGVLIGTALGIAFATGGPAGSAAIRAIALGDVDQDGDLDVVVSRTVTSWFAGGAPQWAQMLLWLNNGAGVFTNVPNSFLPYSPQQIALADFDADGDVDLLTLDVGPGNTWGPSPPRLFLNNAGTFAATGTTIPVAATYDTFTIGFLDPDALPDLILDNAPVWGANGSCAPSSPAPPLLLTNTGNGTFLPMSSLITGPVASGIPRILDLDGDGQQDLLRITPTGAEVYKVASYAAFPLSFQAPIYAASDFVYATNGGLDTSVGDIDGDGDRDMIVFTAQGNEVLFNDSALTPVAVIPTLSAGRLPFNQVFGSGDLEGDGDQDLMLGFSDCGPGTTRLDVATNDGTGDLRLTVSLPCPTCPPAAQIGQRIFLDVDGDGDLDAFVVRAGNGVPPVHYVLMNTVGTLAVSQALTPAGAYTNSIRSGDLDGDGDPDIVVGMNYGAGFRVLLNSGGSYQPSATIGPDTWDFEFADLDGDGDLDLVKSNAYPSSQFVYLNDGSGNFTPAPPAGQPAAVSSFTVEAADFDGDGDIDLLMGNQIHLNSGTGAFTPGGIVPFVNWSPGATAFGNVTLDFRLLDVDGDGDLDVLDNRGWFHRNLGGTWATENLPRPLTFPIVVADFDRDGDQDLVLRGPAILTNMTRQLSRKLPPRPGRPASLEIGGAPGTPWSLYASTGSGSLNLPPLGLVRLDLANLQLAGAGTIPSAGLSVVGGITPTVPGIVGFSVYWQAVMFEVPGPRLTGLEMTTVAAY